jgi:hypothetical protein
MVSGRADKGKAALPAKRALCRGNGRSRGIRGNLVGMGVDVGVLIDIPGMKRALGKMAPDIYGIADEIIVHVPLALLAEPFQVPRVVDAFDIAGGCRDRIVAGNLIRQPVDDTEEPVLALDMPLTVVLLEDRAGDCRIVHLAPRVKTGI